jgi:hypothetical protein
MMERKWLRTGCLGFMFLMACRVAKPASQDQREKSFYTSTEYTAFQVADEEKNPHAKIKLLDDFSIKYPDSTLVPQVYRDYYLTYFSMTNYRRTVEYADKFLAFGNRIDPGDRLEALTDRAQAFFAGCGDAVFQTPEAYASAKTAAVQGLEAVSQFPIPPNGSFVRLKIHVQDRTGRQIGSAERIVRLSPDSVRKKTNRYQSPSSNAAKP